MWAAERRFVAIDDEDADDEVVMWLVDCLCSA